MKTFRSLLRYPGGKARFANFIDKSISLNGLNNRLLIEPFCGGAAVALSLLVNNRVNRIALNDADPLVAALWQTVFDTEGALWLEEQIRIIPVTLDEWRRQRSLEPANIRESALKCLFLNRTSFNGIILKSGPIGGYGQQRYTVDARFNRLELVKRLRFISQFRDQVVSVDNMSWCDFCDKYRNEPDVVFYLDPPFYHKAKLLYTFTFTDDEHAALSDYLVNLQAPWMLSYDEAREIRALYGGRFLNARVIDNTYSAHPIGGASVVGRELFYTNQPHLPSTENNTGVPHVGLTVRQDNMDFTNHGILNRYLFDSTVLRMLAAERKFQEDIYEYH